LFFHAGERGCRDRNENNGTVAGEVARSLLDIACAVYMAWARYARVGKARIGRWDECETGSCAEEGTTPPFGAASIGVLIEMS